MGFNFDTWGGSWGDSWGNAWGGEGGGGGGGSGGDNCAILLNDGSSFLLLNSGGMVLLNDDSCSRGRVVATPPAAAPADRGFDETIAAFARERTRTRRLREEEEIMRLAQFEDDYIASLISKLFEA